MENQQSTHSCRPPWRDQSRKADLGCQTMAEATDMENVALGAGCGSSLCSGAMPSTVLSTVDVSAVGSSAAHTQRSTFGVRPTTRHPRLEKSAV